MEIINYKKLNIKVKIIATKKIGLVVGKQQDFWGQIFWIVKVGREVYPFKVEEFKYVSSAKILIDTNENTSVF